MLSLLLVFYMQLCKRKFFISLWLLSLIWWAWLPVCSVCGKIVSDDECVRCGECGKVFCRECAVKDPTLLLLGVCKDCEEVYEAEEDYWGWGEEEEW